MPLLPCSDKISDAISSNEFLSESCRSVAAHTIEHSLWLVKCGSERDRECRCEGKHKLLDSGSPAFSLEDTETFDLEFDCTSVAPIVRRVAASTT